MFCIGIREDLTYEALYFKVASSENEINYTNFFFDLKDKGLEGKNLKMLICDGKKCIENAFLFVYPNRDIQICTVHYVREALRYIRNKRLLPSIKHQFNRKILKRLGTINKDRRQDLEMKRVQIGLFIY